MTEPMPLCQSCGVPPGPPWGWLVECRPTLGGGVIRLILCYACRDLTPGSRDRALRWLREPG